MVKNTPVSYSLPGSRKHPCGCVTQYANEEFSIVWCKLHFAAQELLEALEDTTAILGNLMLHSKMSPEDRAGREKTLESASTTILKAGGVPRG